MFALTTRSRQRVHGRLGLLTLAVALAAAPACGKKGKGSTAPGAKGSDDAATAAIVEKKKRERKTNKLIELANADLKNGRYVSASKRADEALAENPENADAHAILGAARWRQGDFAASTAAYEKALEFDDKNFGAAIGLGRNLQAAGQHTRAIEVQDVLLADDKEQVDPLLMKLWSYYALADADNATKVLDEVFQRLPADDPQLPLIQAYAGFMRPLAGKGPLCVVEGETGSMDAGINHDIGLKYSSSIVGGEFTRVIFFENVEESIIDTKFAADIGAKEIAKFTPLGKSEETSLVIIPELKFGELVLKNVPAMTQPLDPYTAAIGEKPGVILGRQALQAFGAINFDFPKNSLTVSKAAPAGAPDGAAEASLLLISMHITLAPAMPIKIDGSDHEFFVYLGGVYGSGVAVTQKEYLKSGHLPREVEQPDDATNGLKMVYVSDVGVGETNVGGLGGLVLVNKPADQTLGLFLEGTEFELGGYVNTRLMANWSVTYALSSGKVYVKPAG